MGVLYSTINTPIGDVEVVYFSDKYTDYSTELPASSGFTSTLTGSIQDTNSSDVSTQYRYNALIAEPGTRVTFKHSCSDNGSLSLSIAGVALFSVARADFTYSGASVTFTVPTATSVSYVIEANHGSSSISGDKDRDTYTIIQSKDNTTEINSLKSQVTSLQSQLGTANTTISNNNITISNLQGQLATANSTITDLKGQLVTANGTISSLQSQLATANITITDLRAQLDSANLTISQRDATILDLNSQIEALNQIIADIGNGSNQTDEQLANLKLELANKTQELDNLQIKYNNAINTIATLNQQITALNDNIRLLEETLNSNSLESQSRINALNLEIETHKSTIVSLNETVNQLNRQVELLKSQIQNSGSSSNELLEKLTQTERELDELNNVVLVRLQQIESKLDGTSKGMTVNTTDIEEMKSSLIRDITAALGSPRFGFMPLPLAKQSIAVSGELLSDANTGHIYYKQGNKVVSKTIELEDGIDELNEYNKSAWVAISVNSENYNQFITSSTVNSNADNTLSSTNLKIEMDKMKIKYDPLTVYTISVRTKIGSVERAYFKDVNGNIFDCVLRNSNGNDFIYRLESPSVGNTTLYPVIELKGVTTTVESILIYKSLGIDMESDDGNTAFGGDIDKVLIDSNTVVNPDGSFNINTQHPIHVTIPQKSLKTGRYTLVLRVRNSVTNTFTAKTVFNGTLYETKQLDFSKITTVAGGKTGFAEMSIPVITNSANYIEISTTNASNIIVDYFLLSLIDFDRDNFYTKGEVDSKDVPTGKTTNSGNAYTLTTTLVSDYYDGLLCKIKVNANSTGTATFRCNTLAYKNIVDANGNQVKTLKSGIWYHLCYNSETANFTLLGKGGGGNAVVSDVITGKTFTNDIGEQTGTLGKLTNIGSATGDDADSIIGSSAYNAYVGRLDFRNLPKSYLEGVLNIHIKNLMPSNIKKDVLIGGASGIKGTLESFSSGDTINIYDGTNVSKELFYLGPLLNYSKGTNNNTSGRSIMALENGNFVVLTEYVDWGPRWNTYQYDLQWGSMTDSTITCTRNNLVGTGSYSSTEAYKVGNMVAVNSHSYTSDGTNRNTNMITVFNTTTKSMVGSELYITSKRSMYFDINNTSADNTYIYGTIENNESTANTAYGFNKTNGRNETYVGIDVGVKSVMDVTVGGERLVIALYSGTLKIYSNGVYTNSLGGGITSIAVFGNDRGIITYNNRYEYVQFYKNGTVLTYRVLQTYSINNSCIVSYYKSGHVIVSASVTSYIHRTSDGVLIEIANMNPYTTSVMDGVKYSTKNQTGTIQILGAPLYIKKV